MSKRFTDTEKWKRPWYRKLPPAFRELWNYILDSCDHAGIWVEDIELAGLILGFEIDPTDYQYYLGPKLIRVDEDKVFAPSFVEFQYGVSTDKPLDPECSTHKSVIQLLRKHGIDRVTLRLAKGIDTPPEIFETVPKSIETLKDKDKEKDKDQEKEKEKEKGGVGENKNPEKPTFDFQAIYQEYPRKDGKQEGLILCKAQIKTVEDYQKLFTAVRRYRDLCEREGTEKGYIKHFSTFMSKGRWRDFLDPEAGTSLITTTKGPPNRAEARSRNNMEVLKNYLAQGEDQNESSG